MPRRIPEELEEEIVLVLEQITESLQSNRWFLYNPRTSRDTIDHLLQDDFLDNLVLYFLTRRSQAPLYETCATATHPRDEIYYVLTNIGMHIRVTCNKKILKKNQKRPSRNVVV